GDLREPARLDRLRLGISRVGLVHANLLPGRPLSMMAQAGGQVNMPRTPDLVFLPAMKSRSRPRSATYPARPSAATKWRRDKKPPKDLASPTERNQNTKEEKRQ